MESHPKYFILSFAIIWIILPFSGGSIPENFREGYFHQHQSTPPPPYFDHPTSTTNVTNQLGTHAFLPCNVRQLGNKSVSWIRSRDSHILTVDRYTFIADERFQILHIGDSWTLQIKYVQSRDKGEYQCQVTTEPKMSHFVNLDVVVPQTRILGESDVFVKSGSTVQLRCVITQSLEPPTHVFWYHDGQLVINSDGKRQWMERVNGDTTIGALVVKTTERKDSGNFTCNWIPSNLGTANVMLHVINGEHPAAVAQGGSRPSHIPQTSFTSFLFPQSLIWMISFGF